MEDAGIEFPRLLAFQDGAFMGSDRHWLLTSTTYGTWLPGDKRGFVSNVRVGPGPEVRHNVFQTPFDSDIPGLVRSAESRLAGTPVYLSEAQAEAVAAQFEETAQFRGWNLLALAVMRNHVHLVVGVLGDPAPEALLRDFKSYASRRLNKSWPRPASGTWWTESGSTRRLKDEPSVHAAIAYIRDQKFPLVVRVDSRIFDRSRDFNY